MNCYRAPDDHLLKEKVVHPPKVNGDELCDEPDCNDQRRVHIFDRACGRFPCRCTTFKPSGRFYDWKNQLVPDVRMGERASKNLKEIRDEPTAFHGRFLMSFEPTFRSYLEQILEMKRQFVSDNPPYYLGMEDLLLREGKFYEPPSSKLPEKYERGVLKHCFGNSVEIGVHRYDLRYCEGLVWSVIPIVHAWNLDEDGNVVDLTLPEGIVGFVKGYWGVEFSLDRLISLLEERETYGPFIDDYERGYPLYDKPWKT